jgi:hypothetical protein
VRSAGFIQTAVRKVRNPKFDLLGRGNLAGPLLEFGHPFVFVERIGSICQSIYLGRGVLILAEIGEDLSIGIRHLFFAE